MRLAARVPARPDYFAVRFLGMTARRYTTLETRFASGFIVSPEKGLAQVPAASGSVKAIAAAEHFGEHRVGVAGIFDVTPRDAGNVADVAGVE